MGFSEIGTLFALEIKCGEGITLPAATTPSYKLKSKICKIKKKKSFEFHILEDTNKIAHVNW